MYFLRAPKSMPVSCKMIPAFLIIAIALSITSCSDNDDGGSIIGGQPEVDSGNTEDEEDGDDGVTSGTGDAEPVPANPNDVVPEPSELSIALALLNLSDNSRLLTLIEQADLTTDLNDDNSGVGWTLFAFSDVAFADGNFEGLTNEESAALVRGHLYSGRLPFSDIRPGSLSMQEGSVEVVENEDGTITVGGATIIARDREFSNGIIHFVDSVLEVF